MKRRHLEALIEGLREELCKMYEWKAEWRIVTADQIASYIRHDEARLLDLEEELAAMNRKRVAVR